MSDTYVYDKAKYHMNGLSSDPSSWEHASGWMLFFLRWAMDHDLMSDEFHDNDESLAKYRAGALSLFEFFEFSCDLVLVSDMFTDEGNAFARAYFDYGTGRYLEDVTTTLKLNRKDFPLYTEESYAQLQSLFDERYASWKAGALVAVRQPQRPRKWWQFWK